VSLIVPPYPPPRYTAADPEVSARLTRADDPPDYDAFGLVKYHYLADQQSTDGDYGLYRVEIAPVGQPMVPFATPAVPSTRQAI